MDDPGGRVTDGSAARGRTTNRPVFLSPGKLYLVYMGLSRKEDIRRGFRRLRAASDFALGGKVTKTPLGTAPMGTSVPIVAYPTPSVAPRHLPLTGGDVERSETEGIGICPSRNASPFRGGRLAEGREKPPWGVPPPPNWDGIRRGDSCGRP